MTLDRQPVIPATATTTDLALLAVIWCFRFLCSDAGQKWVMQALDDVQQAKESLNQFAQQLEKLVQKE